MKIKTYIFLKNYIDSCVLRGEFDRSIGALFQDYCDIELNDPSKFCKAGLSFLKFIAIHENNIILTTPEEYRAEIKRDIEGLKKYIFKVMSRDAKVAHSNFVKLVNYFTDSDMKILDVGAGKFPFTSIELAKKNDNITAMDNFIVSDELLKRNNVIASRDRFVEDYDISQYDMIVGLKPCEAIGDMVMTAKKWNKPYFINLCHCDAPRYSLKKFDVYANSWNYILPAIDSDVKIFNDFATNLDISNSALAKVILMKCKFTREMAFAGMLSYMNSIYQDSDETQKFEESGEEQALEFEMGEE